MDKGKPGHDGSGPGTSHSSVKDEKNSSPFRTGSFDSNFINSNYLNNNFLNSTNPYYLNLMYCDDKDLAEKINRTNPEDMNYGFKESDKTTSEHPKDSRLFSMDPSLYNGDSDDDDELIFGRPRLSMSTANEYFHEKPLTVVSRKEWGALPPKYTKPIKHPIQNVIITYKTETTPCFNNEECMQRMRDLQKYHMEVENLSDIPYNFLVGHDGTIYEGRGWHAHSSESLKSCPKFRGNRLDFAYIGDYRKLVYPVVACNAIFDLLKEGADEGLVNYYYDLDDYREDMDNE